MIIIDVFRAFSTACYVCYKSPKKYYYTNKCEVIKILNNKINEKSVCIGKPQKGSNLIYDIPNSPSHVSSLDISDKIVLHRTEAGAKGILEAPNDVNIFCASFLNADATVKHVKSLNFKKVTLIPMGHEGQKESSEDELCAHYMEALFRNRDFDIKNLSSKLMLTKAGQYFFTKDQFQYPHTDFSLCLKPNSFSFAIEALKFKEYSVLERCDIVAPGKLFRENSLEVRLRNP